MVTPMYGHSSNVYARSAWSRATSSAAQWTGMPRILSTLVLVLAMSWRSCMGSYSQGVGDLGNREVASAVRYATASAVGRAESEIGAAKNVGHAGCGVRRRNLNTASPSNLCRRYTSLKHSWVASVSCSACFFDGFRRKN
ncbi:hypothetical protein H257_02089 [Aphanomyces astaci]|uniref:Uncharacterized protein n=1 Tax=Aphanomyces astaci TaxID=112090 RepID=W4H5C9_APHAT|nr:hypothetical protein H257_02089 [Aphanomyces astaci]ETV87092.1 hypothetical protein H257_02089 [Aphanomyces astaci]|eukprot:XP_009823891.1 hypothetical protein H257_02089 [Aphanomyces astaci]